MVTFPANSPLSSYANYIVSGIVWIRSFGIAADMIELFPFPQSEESIVLTPRIHPEDLVILANRVRDIAAIRIASGLLGIKILAPGLTSIMSSTDIFEPYTEKFYYGKRSVDFWSVSGKENENDAGTYQSGSFFPGN